MTSPGRITVPASWERMKLSALTQHRLVATEDADGFVLAMGIVMDVDQDLHVVHVQTRLTSLEQVETLHVGDLSVDPHTFRDSRLAPRGC